MKTNFKICGVDPGKHGGIVLVDSNDYTRVWKFVTPIIKIGKSKTEYDIVQICHIFRNLKPKFVVLEKAQVTPKAGKMSCFGMGASFYMYQGILTALKIPFIVVAARDWQHELFKGLEQRNTKQASYLAASRLSGLDFRPTQRSKKPHDGLTDAYCMAIYGIRKRFGDNHERQ